MSNAVDFKMELLEWFAPRLHEYSKIINKWIRSRHQIEIVHTHYSIVAVISSLNVITATMIDIDFVDL